MARRETMLLVMEISGSMNWSLYHLDIKSTFVNDPLEEIVFVTQPPYFEVKSMERMSYKLHKALYGLKQVSYILKQEKLPKFDSTGIQNVQS